MPAVSADTTSLPRLSPIDPTTSTPRPVAEVLTAITAMEGAGFMVRRPFRDMRVTDPFLLLDHLGAVEYGPGEAQGAPDHPHRGFETVTYIMDGAIEHRDSTGGGGVIRDGATQWMTAGAGIVHSEMPPDELVRRGGLFHGTQLWVNLPAAAKWTAPTYQDIEPGLVRLLASADAGSLDGHDGPGQTHTPITYAHASVAAGARLQTAWRRDFNALAYVLAGAGSVGDEQVPIHEGQLAVFGAGDHVTVTAADQQPPGTSTLEVLLLGGLPIREQIAHYGPFVMNTREEILQAVEDFRAGRMGSIPPLRAPLG
jgi:quercetin 2,3-dioxygenase